MEDQVVSVIQIQLVRSAIDAINPITSADTVQVVCANSLITFSFRVDKEYCPELGEKFVISMRKIPSLGTRIGE